MGFKKSGSSRCKLPPVGSEKEPRRRESPAPVPRLRPFGRGDNHRKLQTASSRKVKELDVQEALVGSVVRGHSQSYRRAGLLHVLKQLPVC